MCRSSVPAMLGVTRNRQWSEDATADRLGTLRFLRMKWAEGARGSDSTKAVARHGSHHSQGAPLPLADASSYAHRVGLVVANHPAAYRQRFGNPEREHHLRAVDASFGDP